MTDRLPVEILHERERPGRWEFDAQAILPDGGLLKQLVRLSWADYHLLSPDGTDPPERVAAAAFRCWLDHRERFPPLAALDVAMLRRRIPGADALVAGALRG